MRRDEERPLGHLERRELVGHARPPDVRDPDVDLELVVEAGRREVLDVVRAHHELAAGLPVEKPEGAQVLDAGEIEVRVVAAVVDDPLRVRVREADPRPGREGVLAAHERITSSTSSRFCSISSSEVASRLRRSRGSVFEGRTLKCQSSKSTEIPSRCETRPSA